MVERTLISLPSQLQLIDRLQHLIYLSSSLIFVSGEAGSGKSTLTENLSNVLPSDLQQVHISLVNSVTTTSLRQKIIAQLYDKALFNAEDTLLESVVRLQQSKQRTQSRLIIIDNAEHLPADFIIELCELFSDPNFAQDNTLNVLLLTDGKTTQAYLNYIETHLVSRLQSTLNHLELILPALAPQEASELLLHNFQQVAYQAKLQHQDALNRQLTLCNGNPQKIIKLADDLSQGLLEPMTPSWIKTRLPAVLLMLTLVAIVSAFAAYLYPKFIPHSPQVSIQSSTTSFIDGNVPVDKNIDLKSTRSTNQESLASAWSTFDLGIVDNQSMVGLSDKMEQRVVISDNQLIELTVLSDDKNGDVKSITTKDTINQAPQLLKPMPIANDGIVNEDTVNKDTSSNTSLTNELINEEQESASTAVSDLAAESNNQEIMSVAAELPIDTTASVVEEIKPSVSKQKEDRFLTDSDILLSKNAKYFTIQISGMASRQYLAVFQQKYNSDQKNVFSYKTLRNNKPWFVIVYGEYSSLESAKVATKNLPSPFKGMPTWIKTWQAVHNDLRLNNE